MWEKKLCSIPFSAGMCVNTLCGLILSVYGTRDHIWRATWKILPSCSFVHPLHSLVIIKEEKLLNFQVTNSFLYFKHLLYNIFVHALNILHTVV